MAGDVQQSLIKALLPSAVIVYIVLRARRRGDGSLEWLGVRPSPPAATILWVLGYAAWMLVTDALLRWRGPWDFGPWRKMSVLAAVVRVLAVGVIGPVAEELVFRGFLYERILSRLGVRATIAVTAALWAVLHVEYSVWIILLILVDGVLLGLARHRTRSLLASSLMHIVWNLYAVW